MAEQGSPRLTVIVPVRNEAGFIDDCLESILRAAPAGGIEVLVVDGRSDDGTRERVGRRATAEPRIRLLDNPARYVPTAMNIGIREARGSYIARIDGHCRVEPGYFESCLRRLEAGDWDCVGGMLIQEGRTPTGRAVAAAMSSRVAVGGADFRTGTDRERLVDTLAFGVYRREVFERIGLFDEELIRNQDDELNFRLVRAGGKILLVPDARVRYFVRDSLGRLARQYFQYGYWKLRVMRKHGRPAAPRHLVPSLFLLALAGLGLASPWLKLARVALGALLGSYLLVVAVAAAWLARSRGAPLGRTLLAIPAIHFSYGGGLLRALLEGLGPSPRRRGPRHGDLTR